MLHIGCEGTQTFICWRRERKSILAVMRFTNYKGTPSYKHVDDKPDLRHGVQGLILQKMFNI